MSKKFVVLTCLVFVVGLIVGLGFFRNDFSQYESYTVESDIIQAYFKVFNTSQDSGLGYGKLVAYVIVLNITNPTDDTLRLVDLRMSLAENGSKVGQSASLSNVAIEYKRDFSDHNGENYWYPHSSRLVAFSATGGVDNLGMRVFDACNGYFFAYVNCYAAEGRGGGVAVVFKAISLDKLGQDEFSYGKVFKAGSYFFFHDDSINVDFGSAKIE